eukprot:SAG11_NODE_19845_length_457_cov_2.008380_2_plen_63_part_00
MRAVAVLTPVLCLQLVRADMACAFTRRAEAALRASARREEKFGDLVKDYVRDKVTLVHAARS